ncbi:MAG: metallophosphoesterase, partial [Lachnospiraceae bacterium]|nr:metallophosphoesterase [Lachnospiraceae bacterium]
MSTYVMSDIHGHFDEFSKMLEQIGFSDKDELILAGDYVDRGTQTPEMLRWIEESPENVILLKGNHDAEFAECISILASLGNGVDETNISDTQRLYKAVQRIPEIKAAYFDYYGTIENLIMYKDVTLAELRRWAAMIKEMPLVYRRRVNGKKFIIVHAGYFEDDSVASEKREQFYLYAR